MRVVIDTNVAVSGLLFGGIPGKIIDLALDRKVIWCSSPDLKSEMDRVLMKPKFGLSEHEYLSLTIPVYDVIEWFNPVTKVDIIKRCPFDNHVLECALESGSKFIVTGDRRDLVSIGLFHGIKILQPKAFLETLAQNP